MLTIKGPIRYQKPATVPTMPFDAAIEKMSKPSKTIDYQPALDRQRAILIAERDRHLRELRRLENMIEGLDFAIKIVLSDPEQRENPDV